MVAVSIMIEGQMGLTWPRWRRLCAEVEALGFAGLFRSDHFTNGAPPDQEALEPIVSLAYLADHSERLHFGPLVAPVSFRDPVMLARQASALDDLSGGRFVLGLGAGWQAREHATFGYDLGDLPTRFARLEEALSVVSRLLRDDAPVSHDGRFYQLREARLLPRPARAGGPPLLIGGSGPRRTLPLVARYADWWNATGLTADDFRERSAHLDGLLRAAGREPGAVRRTMMRAVHFGRDTGEVERRLRGRLRPELAAQPFPEALATLQREGRALVGTADQIVEQVGRDAAAGVAELMLQWFDFDDLAGLRAFANGVLPRVA
ncbi:MAG TPA: TIGR03560 family F420-dependent LLM class oxidoreductase [Thermomicrobiales bacterium]|nr:TIGR03560 family F420-dependent LLM class oxidoreductase [Thermomicrobiales bacterium]